MKLILAFMAIALSCACMAAEPAIFMMPLSAAPICGLAPCPPEVPYNVAVTVGDKSSEHLVRVEAELTDGTKVVRWGVTVANELASTAGVLIVNDSKKFARVLSVSIFRDSESGPMLVKRVDVPVMGVVYE